ncbi:MAG TPA: DUF5668 domain-containing protein [Vicinamibacteria bacterium]|nr:DUF5668 domain-containing protein [Vicinamibacteria bacterium]
MSSPDVPETNLPPLPAPPSGPPGAATARMSLIRNPWVAAGLSFLFPGLGQIYNGQAQKAFIFLAGFVGCIYASIEVNPLPFAFGIPFVYFFNIIDAFRSASLAAARATGREPADDIVAESPAWGISLIALGAVILLHNFGWLSLAALARWWPLVLIVAGAWFLKDSLRKREERKDDGPSV